MKKFLLVVIVISSNFSFAQMKKVELTNEEVQFIAENRAGGVFSEPNKEQTIKMMDINNTLHFFEISYKGNIIYRESFQRWNPFGSLYSQSKRTNASLCFNYNDLNSDLILQLLENSKWKSKKLENSKFICNDDFEIFKKNNDKSISVSQIDQLEIKVYKIVD